MVQVRDTESFNLYLLLTIIDHSDTTYIPKRIVPKILYSPNNNITRSIMHKANVTFATVDFILSWMKQIDNCSQYFLSNTNASTPFIVAVRNYTAAILKTRKDKNIQLVHDLVDPDSPNNLWGILTSVSTTSKSIQSDILRLDWDIFYPVDDTEKLIELASNTVLQNELNITSVFAGMWVCLFTWFLW